MYGEGESWKTGSSIKQANMEAFVEWLLTPEVEREHRTRSDFAEWLGVTTQTLRNYERDAFVIAQLDKRRRAALKASKVDDILATLVRRATDDDAGAAGNAAAKIVLDYVEKQTAEVNAEAMREMSDDELKQFIVAMYDRLDA